MFPQLPPFPNLSYLKKQAKDVLRVSRYRHPTWCLADAQQALARGYGFRAWPELKLHVESVKRPIADTMAGAGPPKVASKDARHRSTHPITGAWATDEALVEFHLTDDILTIVQIASDASGIESAGKMAVQTDGQDHPVQPGDSRLLQAKWIEARTLEMTLKDGEHIVGAGTYHVSPDGRSLVVSSANRVLVFTRIEEAR